jgi:hypothetical protein
LSAATSPSTTARRVGEPDAAANEVVAGAGECLQRPGLVAVGVEQAQPVHVGAGEFGEHVRVEAVRLAAAGAVAVAGGGELVRVDRHDGDAGVEQPVDHEAVRPLERDPVDPELAQATHELGDAVLAAADPSLREPPSLRIDHDQAMLLAREVDPGRLLHPVSSLVRGAGCGPAGEVPWRMLMDRPSVGRRPVAAPGASHRREARVSSGPSTGQASLALPRRRAATTRRYERRRSTPSLTACRRTLSFQRTSKTKSKVDP